MAGDIKQKYGASSALSLALGSLATSSTLVAGIESGTVDNTSTLATDYLLAGFIKTGTSPTASTFIEVWVIAALDDTPTWPDVFDGTTSAETVTSRDILRSCGRLATSMLVDNTTGRVYPFAPVSIKSLFGELPKKFVVFVTHSTAVNLDSTDGNHVLSITPVLKQYT